VELAGMLAETVAAGGTHVVMEVSSHALDQRRTAGIEFAVAAFTNLTGDHMDYHGTRANYLAAKRRLFEGLSPGTAAAVNRDDPAGEDMAAAAQAAGARVLWYGLSPGSDVWAKVENLGAASSRFALVYGGREAPVESLLIGRHNVYNCLAAAAAALGQGVPLDIAARALAEVRHVPGRLQRVHVDAPFSVVVDYAHTDDALQNVLLALAPLKKSGRLILVFGCGGDRDRTKRPRMAQVAQTHADRIFVTSDNPRTEDPQAILDEIAAGFSPQGRAKTTIEPDRRSAIAAALTGARAGDVVLIAGKGHENYQIVGTEKFHFDDVETAEEILRSSR
jgi:UDP-N-acetylmuramyl-tripeptide synthetase